MIYRSFVPLLILFWTINAVVIIHLRTDEVESDIIYRSSIQNYTCPEFVEVMESNRSAENTFDQNSGFISLFNGRDLTGWGFHVSTPDGDIFESLDGRNESKDRRFIAAGGILTANPYIEGYADRYLNLWTSKEFPTDFLLTLEFRASRKADSGIFLRGTQLQCRDYLLAGPYKNLKNFKAQDWNIIEVEVKNNSAHCTCNGELLEESLKIPSTGAVGLESDQGQVEYRNIRIKELK